MVINRIRLGGLIYSLESFLQLYMRRELQIFAFVYMYSGASQVFLDFVILLLLLLLHMDVSCHRPFLPGTSLEPAVIPTAQPSSFTLQYFPNYM